MPPLPPSVQTVLRSQRPFTAKVEWFLAVAPYATSPHPNDNPCFQALINQAGWVSQRNVWDVDFDTGVFGDSYDTQQGVLVWNPIANSFQDDGQDFSDWQALIGEALYVIVVVNNTGNISWAFLGVDFTTANPNDSILVYRESTLTTAGWNGQAPGGNAVSYNIYIAPNAGMTLWVDAAAYNAYGEGRVRIKSVEGDAVDGISGTLHVAENSEIEWTDDDFLTVPGSCGFRELWAKYPLLTATNHFMDYDVDYTNQGDHLPPKANGGPPVCAWIDPTTGLATVNYVDLFSYVTEVGAAWHGVTPVFWSFPGGTPATAIVNGTFAAPNTITWNAPGFRYVALTVQDDQDVTARVYIPVWIFDDNEPPYVKVEVTEQRCDAGGGWRVGLKVGQTDTTAEDVIYRFPDGALVTLFTRTWYGVDDDNISVGGWYGPVDGSDVMGDLVYNPDATPSLQDQAPQDFSAWATAPPGNSRFMVVVTNINNTITWGYCGDAFNSGVANDSIHVFQDQGLTIAGWNGTDPVGPPAQVPETYRILPVDMEEGDNAGGDIARSNVRFTGWLVGETLSFNYEVGMVGFTALAHDGILRLIPGWPFTIEDTDANPADWHEMIDVNVDRLMHHLLEYYTTVNMVCHVERVGEGNTRPVKIQTFPDADIYSQLQESLLEDACCLLLTDRQGILRATRDPQMLSFVNRIPLYGQPVCTLSSPNVGGHGDWANELDEDRPHRPEVGGTRIDGIAWAGVGDVTPLLARAPGLAPLQHPDLTKIGNRILVDQAEATLWSGLALTKFNNPYPAIPIELGGYWPVFDPAFQEQVRLVTTDPLGRNPMAAPWGDVFIVREVAFTDMPEEGTSGVDIVVEKENVIQEGEQEDVPPTPAPTPAPVPSPPPLPPPWGGDLTHFILLTTQGFLITETLDEDEPVWRASNSGLAAAAYQSVRDMSFDFVDGSRLFATDAFGATRCDDIWNAANWTMPYINADAIAMINAAGGLCTPIIWTPGQWSCVNCDPVSGYLEYIAGCHQGAGAQGCNYHKRAFYSVDALVSCFVGDHLDHDVGCGGPGTHPATVWAGQVSSSGGNSLYTYVCAWGFGSDQHRGLSTDNGVDVATCGHAGGQIGAWANWPVYSTRAGAIVFYFAEAGSNLFYSADNGSSWVDLGVVLPHAVPAGLLGFNYKQVMCVHNLNSNNLMYCGAANLQRSSTGGVTWGNTPANVPGSSCAAPVMVGGSPEGHCYMVGCNNAPGAWVFLTKDFGESWLDKTGNLDTWLGAGDTIYQMIAVQAGAV